MSDAMPRIVDCLVVGGGPAGLTAAIYLARFRLSVMVVDAGQSRAALIPLTRNHAGFPEGISGRDLLDRMRAQALKFGADFKPSSVDALSLVEDGFYAHLGPSRVGAKTVLIATGVTNRKPPMSDEVHSAAVQSGRLRYCPICDGYEVTDQKVAVIGTGDRGVKEAEFLRSYTSKVTLVPAAAAHDLNIEQRRRLADAGIEIVEEPAAEFETTPDALAFFAGGKSLKFDAVYPALGSEIHSNLAKGLGARLTDEGCIQVDAHQRTSVERLYAAGDVVVGLDQISHAMGEAGVAATSIRNDLAALAPLRRGV